MKYAFECYRCGDKVVLNAKAFMPPYPPSCPDCKEAMNRIYNCEINTYGCKDHDQVKAEARISRGLHDLGSSGAAREEARFQKHIQDRRRDLADGGNQGSFRHTHSVPADLYHGKIKETGDRNYWSDPGNLKRHSSCRVDK